MNDQKPVSYLYSDCPNLEGCFDNVEYIHFGNFKDIECDILISSRQPAALDQMVKAKKAYLWVHDIHVGPNNPQMMGWLNKFDKILCLSQWHKDFFLHTYPELSAYKVVVTSNGIDLDRFKEQKPKKNWLMFPSSANRGLRQMLSMLPEIRKKVPDAELHVYYGFQTWMKIAQMNNNQAEINEIAWYQKTMNETPGVVYHGRVNQKELTDAWLQSKVWAYPTDFTETSCISAMESQAAGCVPVTSALAALKETVKEGFLIPPYQKQEDVPRYREQFISDVVKLLTDDELREFYANRCRKQAQQFAWVDVAKSWLKMFDEDPKSISIPTFQEAA